VGDDPDSSVDHHFTVLVEVESENLDKCSHTHLVELDGERQSPYIHASSKGSSLRDAFLVRRVFDTLRKGADSAAMYKLAWANY
jgi:hypothetical protein